MSLPLSPFYSLDLLLGAPPSMGTVDMSGARTHDCPLVIDGGELLVPHDWPDVSVLVRPGLGAREVLDALERGLPWALELLGRFDDLFGESPSKRNESHARYVLDNRMLARR